VHPSLRTTIHRDIAWKPARVKRIS
jgi:hypothetical protein